MTSKKWLPFLLPGILALWVLGAVRVPKDKPDAFAVQEFGRLPAVANGRFQPLDSLARNSLLQLREKQTANLEPWKGNFSRPKIISATEWLLAMTTKPELADTWPIIRIDNPDLKGLLGLPMDVDPEKQTDGKHYAWNQVKAKLEALQNEARRVQPLDNSHRTPFDQAVLHLWSGVGLYMRLQNAIQPQNARDWEKEYEAYLSNVSAGVTAARAQQAGQQFDKEALDRLVGDLGRFDAMRQLEPPLLVPPQAHAGHDHGVDEWTRMGDALMETARGEAPPFAIAAYARMASAYRDGRVADFNAAVASYRTALGQEFAPQLTKTSREQLFNFFEPFYKAMTPLVLAFVLVLVFWLNPARLDVWRRSAVWLVVLALLLQTAGLLFRMILEGRPPVTNLYSSAVFIGWGAMVLGLVLEAFWKNGIGVVIASTLGFIGLIIAHHLSLTGDTMEMMRAVLDTNFWLATHVVIITLGYASTFVAGFLAILYIVLGVFTPLLGRALNAKQAAAAGGTVSVGGAKDSSIGVGKSLTKMVYGIICFATLFSFVGTVLGGIWADQSWGRFWGWDPKENGALLIVLWNALILHARWGGMVRERGLMNLAIGGNIVTAWSWFGVNMLGIGLHSYGFMDAAFWWLMAFVATQLLLIACGSLPLRLWRSFGDNSGPGAAPPSGAVPA